MKTEQTTLSEQLCRVAGIPAKEIHKCPSCGREITYGTDTGYCRSCGCYSWISLGNRNIVKVSVDFEHNNNNFVRLLEIKSYTGVSLFREIAQSAIIDDDNIKQSFIKKLCDILEHDCYSKNWNDSVIKALQQQEWEY